MNDFFVSTWDYLKRAFGRSKTIFTNIMGFVAASWVELYDPFSNFDWGQIVDKHEVAIAIGMAVQFLNVFFKIFADNGSASFRYVHPSDVPGVDGFVQEEVEEDTPAKVE